MAELKDLWRDTVLGVLAEIQSSRRQGVARTTLVKFVYLLDVFVAEELEGKHTWTGLEWSFLQFGPYAPALADCLAGLEKHPYVDVRQDSNGDKEFVLYSLAPDARVKSLADLEVSGRVIDRLGQAIREYSGSLPRLLDHVYFQTAPMQNARPRQRLSFENCRRINFKVDIRPVKLISPTPQQADRIRTLLGEIVQENTAVEYKLDELQIHDEHYYAAMMVGDTDEFSDAEPIRTELIFRSPAGDE